MPGSDDLTDFIAQAAQQRGIDPNVALRVAQSEGLNSYVGDQGSSFGPFQLHYGGVAPGGNSVNGLGDEFTAATGLDARDPRTIKQQINFALDHAAQNGWGAFHGAANSGIAPYQGLGGKPQQRAPSADFLSDFPVTPESASEPPAAAAGAGNGASAAGPRATMGLSAAPDQSPPQPAGPSASFLTDFPVTPAAAQPAPAPPSPSPPIGVNDAVRAAATGIPVIGGLLNKADAATNAFLAPALNRFFSPQDQLQGGTFGERYQNALAQQNASDSAFAAQHPVASNALGVAGAVGGMAPAMMAAPWAFGLGGDLGAASALSGITGAGISAADQAARNGLEPGGLERSALAGGALGAAAPGLGRLVGAGVSGLSNALNATTPAARNVAGVLGQIGMTPQQAQLALSRMGPSATLADIDPALTTEAAALARTGGAPTSILKGAMAMRAAGADDRVGQAVEQTLGPRQDLTAAKEAVYDAAQQAAGPYYAAARANPTPVDPSPVISSINAQLPDAVGGEAAVLNKARGYLLDANGQPKTDPGALLKVRQALDDDIGSLQRSGAIDGTSAGKNAYRAAAGVRSQLDAVLKTDPNIAAGDAAFAQHMGVKDAMDAGAELFTKGVKVPDFQRALATMSPAELDATRQGALSAIWSALDGARQGALSGARSMFAKSTANRAKLDALFPGAGSVFDMLNGEAAMRATEQRVAQNSVTAEAQAVQQKYAPKVSVNALDVAAPIIGEAVGGGPGALALTGGKMLLNSARSALTARARDRLLEGTARGLSATGPAQYDFMGQLARASRSNAATNALSGHASMLVNAIVRNGNAFLPQPASP